MAERGVDNKLLDGVNASLPRREERNTAIVAVGEKNIVSEFVLFINELKIALLCFALLNNFSLQNIYSSMWL